VSYQSSSDFFEKFMKEVSVRFTFHYREAMQFLSLKKTRHVNSRGLDQQKTRTLKQKGLSWKCSEVAVLR